MKTHLTMLAAYHVWAYQALYEALLPLADDAYRADDGLFFRSAHGTLNHLLLVEQVWFGRCLGKPFEVGGLDTELEPDRARLEQALYRAARRWHDWLDACDESALAAPLAYTNLAGTAFSNAPVEVLTHVFNHATHHRGQVSSILTRHGLAAPVMDLIYFLRSARAPLPTI
ncbi:MAG: DinB family protein [Gammaproteobacteria bacterium]